MKDYPSFVLFFITFIGYLSLGLGFPLEHINNQSEEPAYKVWSPLKQLQLIPTDKLYSP